MIEHTLAIAIGLGAHVLAQLALLWGTWRLWRLALRTAFTG